MEATTNYLPQSPVSSSEVSSRFINWGNTRCKCGVRALMWTSWSDNNPGRRFIGCPFYEDPIKYCRFFHWVDSDYDERYKKIIVSLRSEIKLLKKDGDVKVFEYNDLVERESRMKRKNIKLKENLKIGINKRNVKEKWLWLGIISSWLITIAVVIGNFQVNSSPSTKCLP